MASGKIAIKSAAKPAGNADAALAMTRALCLALPDTEEKIAWPGASSDRYDELFVNHDTASAVPQVALIVEPTLTALEMQAGTDSALVKPLFPDAMMVAIALGFRGKWQAAAAQDAK